MNALTPLDNLSPLPDITGSHSYPANSQSKTAGDTVLGAAKAASGIFPGFSLQSMVVIVLGLLLVAAGIFAFKEVRQTVVTTGKTAAKVAAL